MDNHAQQNWTNEEQTFLAKIIEEYPNIPWSQIATKISEKFLNRQKTGKQCRERYVNYIKFAEKANKINAWSSEDEKTLFKLYRELGTKWTQICKSMPSKSENSLKNKFYGSIRKVLRSINRIGKSNIKKFNKPIKYQSIIRIMDAAEGAQDLPFEIHQDSKIIKSNILDMAESSQSALDINKISDLVKQIHKFNIFTRCYSSRKWRRQGGNSCEKGLFSESVNTFGEQFEEVAKGHINGLQQKGRIKEENIAEQPEKEKQKMDERFSNSCMTVLNDDQEDLAELSAINYSYSNGDDLELELCDILNESYTPQHFDYFEK